MYTPSFKTKRNGVPVLSKEDIEGIGENFMRDFCPEALTTPRPTDIEGFVELYLKLKLDYQYLSNDGRYLGMTVFNDTDKVIIYNPERKEADYLHADARTVIIDNTLLAEDQAHRYRFTMGHEGGHDIFHSGYYYFDPNQLDFFGSIAQERAPMVQCRLGAMEKKGSKKLWTDDDWMEWQANYFSSVILMPKPAMLLMAAKYDKKKFAKPFLVEAVSNTFDVSLEAAKYRCIELGLTTPKEVQTLFATLDFASIQ